MNLKQILTTAAVFTLAAAAFAAEPAVKKVLVFSRCEGFNHKASIAACKEAMAAEAKKGAFTVDFSDNYASLEIGNLLKYDALVLNNTTHMKTKDNPKVAPAICSFVRWGGGFCVIHAGADNFYDAPECAHLVGGRFDGHPWGAGGTWAFKVEDRDNPINAPFKKFADGKKVFFENINSKFLHPDGTIVKEAMQPDLLHLSAEGYRFWSEALKKYL